jgi:hypothetical protein
VKVDAIKWRTTNGMMRCVGDNQLESTLRTMLHWNKQLHHFIIVSTKNKPIFQPE